jgi:hypothetical protein
VGLLVFVGPAAGQGAGTQRLDVASETALLGLPDTFSATASDDRRDEWEITPLKASPLAVAVAAPKGWMVAGGADAVFIALAPDGSAIVAMPPPIPTELKPLAPVTNADLRETAALISSGYERPVVAMGQARITDRLWLWFDLGAVDPTLTAAPTPVPVATAQVWIFSSVIEQHQVVVAFTLRLAPGSDRQEREAEARRAGPIFARMLERLSFTRTL